MEHTEGIPQNVIEQAKRAEALITGNTPPQDDPQGEQKGLPVIKTKTTTSGNSVTGFCKANMMLRSPG
jgi:hypothetical protein